MQRKETARCSALPIAGAFAEFPEIMRKLSGKMVVVPGLSEKR
jgi:hypothetical protein